MGRGTSKVGGGSGSTGGGGATAKAEQAFYDLPKNATQKQVREMIDNAPVGTIIAMKDGKTQVIYERVNDNSAAPQIRWMRTTNVDGQVGMGTNYDRGYIGFDIRKMAKSKNVRKGLTADEKKKYKKHFNSVKSHFTLD